MFALEFQFPAGRYHASPWGRSVNEAAVAWPPEPWRLLRALIAAYWRKGDHVRWSVQDLADLIDALSEHLPVYRVPEGAIHTHTRHYMPIGRIADGRERTTLVFDAFLRLPEDAVLVAAWPRVHLEGPLVEMASHLASRIGYLGRAESWADCAARTTWEERGLTNCRPAGEGLDGRSVRLLAPLTSAEYSNQRALLRAQIEESERRKSTGPVTDKRLRQLVKHALRSKATGSDTLPPRLADALTLETSDFLDRGWTRPPASREVLYALESNAVPGVTPRVRSHRRTAVRKLPTVARFLLAGRPLPRVEESVKLGELMRRAAMHKFGWDTDEQTGRRVPKAPWQISGRGPDGQPLRVHNHAHAFWLAEDVDGDGLIDHVAVFVRSGIADEVRRRLDGITRLWETAHSAAGEAEAAARREWRLALEGFGSAEEFAADSRLFGKSARWGSVTPFLASGHLKAAGHAGEARRLLRRRELDVEGVHISRIPEIPVGGATRRPLQFHRFRQRGREVQHDAAGAFLEISFPEPIEGPLALGYGCHFGLGLFARLDE